MKRNTRLDYRCYEVELPNSETGKWCGLALLEGMPNLTAWSEADLRQYIDNAHKARG